jgi:hypothetical protein
METTYMYFTNHGVGPGTLPVSIKIKEIIPLKNMITALILEQKLNDSETDNFDLISENDFRYEMIIEDNIEILANEDKERLYV